MKTMKKFHLLVLAVKSIIDCGYYMVEFKVGVISAHTGAKGYDSETGNGSFVGFRGLGPGCMSKK